MILQTSVHPLKVSLSSSLSYSRPLPSKIPTLTLPRSINCQRLAISCSISQVHNYGTVDYERRPIVKWNAIYRKLSLLADDPESNSSSVLNQWEKEGKKLSKWELCRVVKELRKFKRYGRALEVMNIKEKSYSVCFG